MVTKNLIDTCHGKLSKYCLWLLVSVCLGSRIVIVGKKRILVDKDGVIGRKNDVLPTTALRLLTDRNFVRLSEDKKTLNLSLKGFDVAVQRIKNAGFQWPPKMAQQKIT